MKVRGGRLSGKDTHFPVASKSPEGRAPNGGPEICRLTWAPPRGSLSAGKVGLLVSLVGPSLAGGYSQVQ